MRTVEYERSLTVSISLYMCGLGLGLVLRYIQRFVSVYNQC